MRRRLNRLFRTKANHNVIKQGWKFRMYMRLVRLTDERRKDDRQADGKTAGRASSERW